MIHSVLLKSQISEKLVMCDLLKRGFLCFETSQHCRYDLILDNGEKLLKIQVKSIVKNRKSQKATYHKIEVDILAYVDFEQQIIYYVRHTNKMSYSLTGAEKNRPNEFFFTF